MKLHTLTLLSGVIAAALALGLAGCQSGDMLTATGQPDAGLTRAAGPTRKIVVFDASVVNQAAKEQILARTGATRLKSLPIINAAVVLAGPANEAALKAMPGVLRVEEDAVATVAAVRPASGEVLPWGVDRIDADRVWDADANKVIDAGANAGRAVKVAVVDTGIDLTHPDLAANVVSSYNAIATTKSATDDNGHGSHVAGIIAGIDNTVGVLGVAPQTKLMAVKVLDRNGSGYYSDIIEGIQWSMNNGAKVINMSLGGTTDMQSLHDAIIAAYNAGIVIVVAAGNSGPGDNTVNYPAKYPEVIAVSATDSANAIASFSSRGPEVDLAAPGVSIYSTYKGGTYATLSGTSMAAPHVAGAAALVIASGRATAPADVKALLQSTADDLGISGQDNLYGYGLVDAQEAATGVQN